MKIESVTDAEDELIGIATDEEDENDSGETEELDEDADDGNEDESEDADEPGSDGAAQPATPASSAKRKRGRPRIHPIKVKKPRARLTRTTGPDKREKTPSELPPPPRFQTNDPNEIFKYIRSIPEDKRARYLLAFYRYLPIIDATEGGTKNKAIDMIPGESHENYFATEPDWEKIVLHRYGSGNYGVYLNETGRTVMRCFDVKTRWDLENYPPILDPKTLDEAHPQNKSYIQYLRQKGISLPTQQEKENEAMQVSAMETMATTIKDLASRQNVPVPPAPPSQSEAMLTQAATAAIGIVKDTAAMQAKATSGGNDGLQIAQTIISAAREMGGGNKGPDPVIALLMQQGEQQAVRIAASEDRYNRLMERMLDDKDRKAATPEKSLIDAVREAKELLEVVTGGGKAEGEEGAAKPGGWTDMLWQQLPTIAPMLIQGAFGLVDRVQNAYVSIAAANAAAKDGRPVEAAVAQVQAKQVQQQPQQQIEVPPGMDPALLQQYHMMLNAITPAIIEHLRNNQTGETFARWFIDGNGQLAYDRVAGTCKRFNPETQEVTTDIEGLMTIIKTFPPLWGQVAPLEIKFRQFILEFVTYEEAPEEEEESQAKGATAGGDADFD